MIIGSTSHHGATGTVYVLQKGHSIPRQQYAAAYSTSVIRGRTRVLIYGRDPIEMTNQVDFIELPGGIPCEITALEDNTVVLHLIKN